MIAAECEAIQAWSAEDFQRAVEQALTRKVLLIH